MKLRATEDIKTEDDKAIPQTVLLMFKTLNSSGSLVLRFINPWTVCYESDRLVIAFIFVAFYMWSVVWLYSQDVCHSSWKYDLIKSLEPLLTFQW